jgi:hypothetical protein
MGMHSATLFNTYIYIYNIFILVYLVCDNMLKDLERESNLLLTRKHLPMEQDVFGAESRREILEPYDEKKEAEWRGNSTIFQDQP